jgi:hypothetical protein
MRCFLRFLKSGLPILLILLGAALVTAGIMRGETDDIMRKGVVVCLECIGVG